MISWRSCLLFHGVNFYSSRLCKLTPIGIQFSSVAQSCPILCDPMGCSTPGSPVHHQHQGEVCSNSCPSSWWCHPTISSSVFPFSSCLQSVPASESFPGIQAQGYCSSPFPIVAWSQGTSPLYSSLVLPAASTAARCEGLRRKFSPPPQTHQFVFPPSSGKEPLIWYLKP